VTHPGNQASCRLGRFETNPMKKSVTKYRGEFRYSINGLGLVKSFNLVL